MAAEVSGCHVEADMFFMRNGEYQFDASKLGLAHAWCQNQVRNWMRHGAPNRIVVSNTFTQDWELEPYYELAREWGWTTFSIVVENRHGGVNQHGVPSEVLDKMQARFSLQLK